MANYDMSIRVNTDIDTSQMKRLQIQIDKAAYKVETLAAKYEEVKNKRIPTEAYQEASKQIETAEGKLAKLVARQEEMIETGRNSGTAWESLQYKIEEIRNFIKYAKWDLQDLVDTGEDFTIGGSPEEIAEAGHELAVARAELDALITKKEEMQAVNLKPQEWAAGFSQAAKSGKKLFSVIQKGSKKSNGLLSTMSSRLKGLALSLLVFNWISKGFNALVSSMREGFKNLAKYSGEYNVSMSALKSECAQLKNGLAAAFEPVVTAVIPYITQLVSWLNVAADAMARFLAALSGKSTYTRAKKQVIDYAKSLDTASKAAKGALAAFDDINVLQKNDSGSRGAGGELVGADAFETADVGADMQAVVNALQPFRDAIDGWLANLDFTSAIVAFDELKESCAPFAGYLYDGMLWFLNNVLLPIGKWTIEDVIPEFFYLLSAALDALNTVWVITQPYLAWLWDNFLAPAAAWVGDRVVDGLQAITAKLREFSDWATANSANMSLVASIVLGFFAGIVTYYSVKKIVDVISKIKIALSMLGASSLTMSASVALAAVAIGVLAAGIIYLAANWDKLSGCQKAITILGTLAAAAMACAVAVAIFHTAWSVGLAAAAIVGGLTLLGLTAACLKYNGNSQYIGSGTSSMAVGKSISDAQSLFNATSSNPLPALATGGITTRPTTALIGEAGREAVLPLENNTEWMDVLANKIAPNVTIRFEGSLAELGRVLKPVIDAENTRIGKSFRKI